METQDCKKCGHKFKVEALMDGLCDLCGGQSPQAKDESKIRVVSSETIREDDVVRIVKEMVPTRDQIKVMIKVILKEELAAMNNIVGNEGPTSVIDSGQPIAGLGKKKEFKDRVFNPKNCIKCGNEFTPKVGFQKICDNCRKETKN